jgi:cytochrome c-type biogenesis protein CcmH
MESLKPEHLKNNSLYGAIAVAFVIVLAVGFFGTEMFSESPSANSKFIADPVAENNLASFKQFASPVNRSTDNPAMSLPLNQLTERLANKLKKNPEDVAGWTLLARSYSTFGETEKSDKAFEKALALAPKDASLRVTIGETLMSSADGQITSAAKESFKNAYTIDPSHPGVRYYLALADYQDGKIQEAYDAWKKLAKETLPNAPWKKKVDEKLAQAEAQLNTPT